MYIFYYFVVVVVVFVVQIEGNNDYQCLSSRFHVFGIRRINPLTRCVSFSFPKPVLETHLCYFVTRGIFWSALDILPSHRCINSVSSEISPADSQTSSRIFHNEKFSFLPFFYSEFDINPYTSFNNKNNFSFAREKEKHINF